MRCDRAPENCPLGSLSDAKVPGKWPFLKSRKSSVESIATLACSEVECAMRLLSLSEPGSSLALAASADSEFRSLCCSNRRAAQSIRGRAASTSPVSSRLGGQNGEEGKVEDEVSGEEDGAQDRQAAEVEEEVVTPRRCERLRKLEGSLAMVCEGQRRVMRPRTPRRFEIDDGGRRRNRRSIPAGSALEPTCKSVSCLRKVSCRQTHALGREANKEAE
jgi:hypothetical protein